MTQHIKGEPGFDGTLVPGVVYGLRAFGVTEDGYLTGVTFKQPWQAGVNHAQCLRGVPPHRYGAREPIGSVALDAHVNSFIFSMQAALASYGLPAPTAGRHAAEVDPVDLAETPDHSLKGCGCGYWSYWSAANDYGYGYERRLTGVIAGWGRIYAGKRGFRCTKAAIQALHIPPKPTRAEPWSQGFDDLHDAFDKVRARYGVAVFSTVDALTTAYPPDDYETVRATRRVESGDAA